MTEKLINGKLGYGISSSNPERWNKMIGYVRPQENEYTRMERVNRDDTGHNFSSKAKIVRENWTDGDGYREPQPSLSNKYVCKRFLEICNHEKGIARNRLIPLFQEWLDTLEFFNICRTCKSPIKTKKHRIIHSMKAVDGSFVMQPKQEPRPTMSITRIERKVSKLDRYLGKRGELVKTRDTRKAVTYKSVKTGDIVEKAIIPEHYEIEFYLNREKIDATNRNLLLNYMDKNFRCRFVKVEETHEIAQACNCHRKFDRILEKG